MQRSAAGHSITIDRFIKVKEAKLEGIKGKAYSIEGTPADCTKIAIEKLLDRQVDLVISGINHGTNLGSDVVYSGTVSAAMEAAFFGIPAFAVSTNVEEVMDYKIPAHYARIIIEQLLEKHINKREVYSINIPMLEEKYLKGFKVCRLGNREYTDCYTTIEFADGSVGYKLVGYPTDSDDLDTDIHLFKAGYATITPLICDLSHTIEITRLNFHNEK
jgi:5'-nucleotidase